MLHDHFLRPRCWTRPSETWQAQGEPRPPASTKHGPLYWEACASGRKQSSPRAIGVRAAQTTTPLLCRHRPMCEPAGGSGSTRTACGISEGRQNIQHIYSTLPAATGNRCPQTCCTHRSTFSAPFPRPEPSKLWPSAGNLTTTEPEGFANGFIRRRTLAATFPFVPPSTPGGLDRRFVS